MQLNFLSRTEKLAPLVIIILGFLVYFNSLPGQFIWDDHIYIENNPRLESFLNIGRIFTEDVGIAGGRDYDLYRPLQMLTYLINYSLWGLNPGGYHFTNILLHVLVGLSLYWLLNIIFRDKLLSLVSSLLFVVHPINTEAVSYISGRQDSLAAFFLLASLGFYVKYMDFEKPKAYLLILFSYGLALLSKESSLIFPLLVLLYHYVFRKRLALLKMLAIVALILLYLGLRFFSLNHFLPHIPGGGNILSRIPIFFAALTNYLGLLLMPLNLHMEYGDRIFHYADPKVISGFMILLASLFFFFRQINAAPVVSFAIGWFFIAILPVTNIYRINSSYMMEHWLYFPAMGFFLLCAYGVCCFYRGKNRKSAGMILVIALLGWYSFLTVRQNLYWRDDLTFYERTIKFKPNTPRVYYNLGIVYAELGRTEEAIQMYQKAIELAPDYFLAHNNLAVVYYSRQEYELAIRHADLAAKIGYAVSPEFLRLLRPYRLGN